MKHLDQIGDPIMSHYQEIQTSMYYRELSINLILKKPL